jgi:methanethiol S-methyltransferase
MKKILSLFYALICYLAFFGTVLYMIGFIGNLFVPRSIDGVPQVPFYVAILINASLLILVGLQYSIIIKPGFRNRLAKIIPRHLERSTFVLIISLSMMLLMWKWQPVGGVVWSVDSQAAREFLFFVYLFGWSIVFASTFLINHFDLVGLRQVWFYVTGKRYTQLPFRSPLFYRLVSHPLYLGFLIAFWSTSVMTAAHLLFAIIMTTYILNAIQFEERDLLVVYGEKYRNYKKWVPMIIPFVKPRIIKK